MGNPLVVAVLVYASGGSDAPTAPGARGALVESLKSRVSVVDHAVDVALADRAAGWRDRSELAFLTRGRNALDLGRKARDRVEHDESERQLAEAEAAYAEGIDDPGVPSLAAEAALEHGVTLAELGRTDDARAAFERALGLWPRSTLTERVARPDVVRLFRAAHATPVPTVAPTPDLRVTTLERLRSTPTRAGAEALRASLDLDAVIVVASSSDGARLIAARVGEGCATETQLVTTASIGALLDAPCDDRPLDIRLDDPRLAAPRPPIVAQAAMRPPVKERRAWVPYVAGASAAVAAAIIGVTIGFVLADPRYRVTVGKGF